ncbi:MAG TPA: zinc ABC transporter substrate-binding protein [Verrucomicrobiae bacterium]|nr:zinc ABC transporter substrate-binding protein [Verrucomicrobiae bacterium]
MNSILNRQIVSALGRSCWFSFLLVCCGCVPESESTTSAKLHVVATVSMVADLVTEVAGDRAEVTSLMGPGVDPHLYKATTADLNALRRAEVVFYCGLMLEGKLQSVLSEMGRSKRVYAVAESIPPARLLKPTEFEGHPDPHVWFDVELWILCVNAVVKGLSEARPADAAYFATQGESYKIRLKALHEWAIQKSAELPPEKRILATSHDAFNYFGRAYGFKVVALQGISTVTEASLADVVKMVEYIKANKINAVFVESSVSPKTIERVSQDAGVTIGGELFSDALGQAGKMENGYDVGTYEGMIRHNLETIVNALR